MSRPIKNLLVSINMPADFCVSSSIELIGPITIGDWGLQGVLKSRTPTSITTMFPTGSYAINKADRIYLSFDTSIISKS